ncbi:MAG: hypothetical protein HQL38_06370 [Alphaproteobacteria bacterium]|nr:hypothetical protein [Alphaproteobacteria bacterium]MBF0392289.1 hypothetical protein [Alphaproteobacteria bacterium]
MPRKANVDVGDRFRKVGQFQPPIWVVTRLFTFAAEPPHARLEKEDDPSQTMTVSLPALQDSSLFRRA